MKVSQFIILLTIIGGVDSQKSRRRRRHHLNDTINRNIKGEESMSFMLSPARGIVASRSQLQQVRLPQLLQVRLPLRYVMLIHVVVSFDLSLT